MTEQDRVEQLIAELQNPAQREHAIKTLATMHDPRAIDALVAVLLHKDAGYAMAYRPRQLAAEALGTIGDVRALPGLLTALEDPSTRVRVSITRTLGRIGSLAAVSQLAQLLQDREAEIRAAAALALADAGMASRSTDPIPVAALLPLLADDQDVVREAADASLLALRTDAVEALINGLQHLNSTVRGAAASLLGRIGDMRAVEALRVTRQTDSSRWVRSRAEGSLQILVPDEKRDQSDLEGLPTPQETLNLIRSQQPPWPTLRPKSPSVPPESPAGDEKTLHFSTMSADDIRAMLDHLDLRLINGDISEATYYKLAERWQARLRELGEN